MLNSIFYLSDNFNHFNQISAAKPGCNFHLSFLTTASQKEKLVAAYHFFSEKNTDNFSLSVMIDLPAEDDFLYDLTAFFFLPGYCQINNQPIIHFICDKDQLFIDIKNRFSKVLKLQGIVNVTIIFLSKQAAEDLVVEDKNLQTLLQQPLMYDTNKFIDLYKKVLQSNDFYDNYFYLHDPVIEPGQAYLLIQQAEDQLKIVNPKAYHLVEAHHLSQAESKKLKIENEGLSNELANYKTHVDMLRSAHEAKELQAYYDKEYEVLPLWYKRFGHLLKVIMGKRSFRSLLNNNKNYKD